MPFDIKICGLKTDEAVAAALAGGATHIGFIFFPKSPRNIAPAEAGLLRQAAYGHARAAAVTVDADDAALDAIVAAMQRLPVMKALAISSSDDLARIEPYRGVADRFLFDAKPPAGSELPGGNGVSFDWTILAKLDPSVDYLLSGGLTAGNVAEALRLANPPGLDISSGVESAPGVKDPTLIRAFFESVAKARLETVQQD
jgi:phosphoribosylanthranilate isomerase